MKWFAAGLSLVNIATIAGLLLGILGGGLDEGFAVLALILGIAAAIWAWNGSSRFAPKKIVVTRPALPLPKSKRARRRLKLKEEPVVPPPRGAFHLWAWAVGIVFAIFAVRSFCWVLWIHENHLRIQSPNNLGDLALHLTYIKYFANGVALWPDNPIYVFSKLRYPAGVDFFNSLLLLLHFDLIRVLVWSGLLGCAATFYAFYRWGGPFAVAGFLFNGGLAGFAFFASHQFIDYQGQKFAWKSIPLTMFVTQRGLLYAIPAGLLLLLHWRRKYFPGEGDTSLGGRRGLVPWWVEWSIYATMPLFHFHTFLALSGLLAFWLLLGDGQMRKEIAILFGAALIPASGIVWMITDHFQAKSILQWAPGWLQSDPAFSTGGMSGIVRFWLENFGLLLPAVLVLAGVVGWRMWKNITPSPSPPPTVPASPPPAPNPNSDPVPTSTSTSTRRLRWSGWRSRIDPATWRAFAFIAPALGIFLFAIFVKTAPWGWDNTKLMIWAYFIWLPFLWRELLARWHVMIRAGVCFVLFFSGFVSLFGGLKEGIPGFDIADRTEVNSVAHAVKKLPVKERFAAFPTYNHPLLLNGRKVVLGYPGHLWTQGFADYGKVENQLRGLMAGVPDWRERARALQARYLFWGNEEKRAYAGSLQPWIGQAAVVASGPWGTIYDLQRPVSPGGE